MSNTKSKVLSLVGAGTDESARISLGADGKVTGWSAQAEQLTGYLTRDIIGKHFTTFHSIENLRRGRPAEVLKLAASDGSVTYADWHVKKDGSHFWASVTITGVPQPGGLFKFAVEMRLASPTNQLAESLRARNAELEAQLGERTTQLGERTTELGERTAQLGVRTGELSSQTTKLGVRTDELSAKAKEFTSSEARRVGLTEQLDERTAELGERTDELSAKTKEFKSSEARGVGLSERLGERTAELGERTTELGERTAQLGVRTGELSNQTSKLGVRTDELNAKTEEFKSSEARGVGLSEQLGERTAQLGERTTELGERTAQLGVRTGELSSQTTKLGERTDELSAKTKEFKSSEARGVGLTDQLGKRTAQLSERSDELSDKTKQFHSSEARNVTLGEQLGERTAQLGERTEELGVRTDELGDQTTRLDERTAQLTAKSVEFNTIEALNKELEAFTYAASHDLRAPLRSIDGFSQVLLEDYADKLDAVGQGHLNRIRVCAQRMGQLIDDLIGLSSLTRGSLKRVACDLSSESQQIADELQRTKAARDVSFEIAAGLTASCDVRLMRIVLENLLGNAFKYTSKVTAAQIAVGCIKSEKGPVYFVRDNGAGFDMKYVHKLFGPFQRLHSSTEFAGNGIGLATVQRIINRHGGQVWAEGEVGKGTTIYFTL